MGGIAGNLDNYDSPLPGVVAAASWRIAGLTLIPGVLWALWVATYKTDEFVLNEV
jgi:hypothetical protein